MRKRISLLLAVLLVMTLVPVSSFAGTITPESGYTIQVNTKDTVEVAYKYGATERNLAQDDVIEFVISNNIKIEGVEVYANRSKVDAEFTKATTSAAAKLTIKGTMPSVDDIVFVFSLDANDADEGSFTMSARVLAVYGQIILRAQEPNDESNVVAPLADEPTIVKPEYMMFSNRVIGTVVEKASSDFTVTRLGDIQTVSKDGGTAAKFEIKNISTSSESTMKISVDNGMSISGVKFTKDGFPVTLASVNGVYKLPADQKKLTVELTLAGSSKKTNLEEVIATVEVDGVDKYVTIAEVVDYEVSIKAVEKDKKVIPTILAGDEAEVVVTVKAVTGTLIGTRPISFELDGAKFKTAPTKDTQAITINFDSDSLEDGEFSILPGTATNEFKFTMKLVADGDAQYGVATLTASGRDLGDDITIDVLNVEKAFVIKTSTTDIVRGESRETEDIVIKEMAIGQFKVGDVVKIDLSNRLTFNEEPTIEGTNGLKVKDIDLDNDDNILTFKISAKSKGKVGTITISDVAIDMSTSGINGRTYSAELKVGDISYGEFAYVKCVAEYEKATSPRLVFTLGSANYTVDGVAKTLEASVFTRDGRTMLPIGPLALGLGLDVSYNADTKTATFRNGATGQVVSIKENASVLYNNGIAYKMYTSAVTVNGRIFVPLASITDAFGVSISWDQATKKVTVN